MDNTDMLQYNNVYKEKKCKHYMMIFLLAFLLIIVVWVVLAIFAKFANSERQEAFSNGRMSNYEAELELFKSLQPDEQMRYLNMNRDEKMSIYGKQLIKQ